MTFRFRFLLVLLAAACLIGGCSDGDDPGQPGGDGGSLSAILHGEIPRDMVDFEFSAEVGKGADDPRPGSILVRGRNLAYDGDAGALTVDLSVLNDGDMTYDEAVGLTFLQFIPDGVTVLDADNGESGAGALFLFDFENDDARWTPGEESLARTVKFDVAAGTSIGFVARVDVGLSPLGGTIGGLVWHDVDEDGEIDEDENGVGGITMTLHGGDDLMVTPLATVMTAEDGTYRFAGLDAGYYTVVRGPRDGMVGTTSPEMAVILVEMDGTVSDFLLANFGVTRGGDPGDDFVKVGDYVDAKGDYEMEPHRLVAEKFEVHRCDGPADKDRDDCGDCNCNCNCDDCDDDCDDCDDDCECECDCDCDDGCRQNECWGRLDGPVTAFSLEDGYIEIMGTKVYCGEKSGDDGDGIECGFQVKVDATRDAEIHDGEVVACRKAKFSKKKDQQVRGFVQEVVRGDDDRITGVVILNTLVEVSRDED